MKRFLIDLLGFAFISIVAIFSFGEVVGTFIQKTGNNVLNNADFVVNEAIRRSKHRIKTKHLILGESVGNQLYGNCTDSIVYSLTASVGIMDIGNFMLLSKFLDINKDQLPEDVIMLHGPAIWNWKGGLANELFYSSFIKNFCNDDFLDYMTDGYNSFLDKFPMVTLARFKAYQYSPYLPDMTNVPNDVPIDSIQYKYTKKTQLLCEKMGVKFRIVSGPMRESRKLEVDSIKKSNSVFSDIMYEGYFESIKYFADDCFADLNHLKSSFIPNDYLNLYK